MDYIVKYDGDKNDIVLADKNCEKAALGIANNILVGIKENAISHETAKEHLIELIKVCIDWGSIKAIEKIIDGKFDEGVVDND